MDNDSVIAEYERSLIGKTGSDTTEKEENKATGKGKKNRVNFAYFKGDPKQAESTMIVIYRYLIEYIMHWEPKEAAERMNEDLLDKMHLSWLTEKYIAFPPGLAEDRKMYYIVSLCYPKDVHFSKRRQAMEIYEHVLDSHIKTRGKGEGFPRGFFNGVDGNVRAIICLNMALSRFYPEATAEDLYKMFSDEKAAYDLLDQFKLTGACKEIYPEPIDFFNDALSEDSRDTFLYSYYSFLCEYRKALADYEREHEIKPNFA